MKNTKHAKLDYRSITLVGIIGILLFVIYQRPITWVFAECYKRGEYSHGLLVPFISLFLIVRIWQSLSFATETTYKIRWPISLMTIALLVQLICLRAEIYFISAWSCILLIFSLVWYFQGKENARKLAFPIFFLLVMVPLPGLFIDTATFPLKLLAAEVACRISEILGIVVVRDGVTLFLSQGSLLVGNPCSGIRSLLALSTCAILFSYIMPGSLTRRIILVFTSIPIAVFTNITRVTVLCIVASYKGTEIATGTFHDVSGFIMSIFGIIIIGLIGKYWLCPAIGKKA
ncbi:MAG: exosortase/archaeosortase family protein [Candidatus Scalindua rubra]|uniref:Putative exosortase n=1 Tax=Candidatus Scalindua brodae TaxID=237368 RepID=A0A0B0EIE5_9BACT|nr:MAG: putative exosortase [Candidatus Scalindua brodae]MBZ0108438.1 exosortase/archaeosortase family protein [Candidatus Scalindua rubra]TWU28798.1 Transmembrane exosortase [Candidatus Brocadiaceae bacterium S225]